MTVLRDPIAVPGPSPTEATTEQTSATRRPRSRARRVAAVLGWVAILAVVVLAWPVRFGGQLGLTVVSGQSMAGTYESGDLVATWRTHDYSVGDVVVYRIPDGGVGEGVRVVHRIVDERPDGSYRTQGDNTDYADPWVPTDPDIDGRVFAAAPGAGTLLTWLLSPWALLLVAASFSAAWVYRLVVGD